MFYRVPQGVQCAALSCTPCTGECCHSMQGTILNSGHADVIKRSISKRSQKTGDRFKKNFDDNLYGAEQMEVSYNRQPQPVDVAGNKKQTGSLKSIKST